MNYQKKNAQFRQKALPWKKDNCVIIQNSNSLVVLFSRERFPVTVLNSNWWLNRNSLLLHATHTHSHNELFWRVSSNYNIVKPEKKRRIIKIVGLLFNLQYYTYYIHLSYAFVCTFRASVRVGRILPFDDDTKRVNKNDSNTNTAHKKAEYTLKIKSKLIMCARFFYTL